MTPDIDLEIAFSQARDQWVVRVFGGDPLKVFAVGDTVEEVAAVAVPLAKVFAEYINADSSCELYWREKDTGEIRERNTYPRAEDPPESKG